MFGGILLLLLLLILTASGYVPGSSDTTIHNAIHKKHIHTQKTIHNTQNEKHNNTKLQT
jgi:hypothetical protein